MRAMIAMATILLLAGCTAPETERLDETSMAPGTTSHVLLHLEGVSDPADLVLSVADADGLNVTLPERFHHNGSAAAGWIGLGAPLEASGARAVVVDVAGAAQQRITIPVDLDAGGQTIGVGAIALVDYTLRSADGTLAETTQGDVEASPLGRADVYQPAPQHEPQPLALSPQQLPPILLDPLTALAVGQTVTISLPDYYGPLHEEHERPREEALERHRETPRYETVDRQEALQSGIIDESTQEGDTLDAGGFTYRVETLNETTLRVELDADEGDRVTLYDAWPEATTVQLRDATTVVFRTDPPDDGSFTWNPGWPDATTVAELTDEWITLRHSPAEGTRYMAQTQQGPREHEIVSVGDNVIIINETNPNPMAGQTFYLEVTMVGEGEPQPMVS